MMQYCKRGHDLSGDNARFKRRRDGRRYRECVACRRARDRASYRKKREGKAKRTTLKKIRCSISVREGIYRRFQVYCSQHGIPLAAKIEDLIAPLIEGIEDPGRPLEQPARRGAAADEIIASGIFTF